MAEFKPYYHPFAVPKQYNTELPQADEFAFRQWVTDKNIPFNPDSGVTDYDMRGFYNSMQQGHPVAKTAIGPNDQMLHFPDRFKTPAHEGFSSHSQWAGPGAPSWINNSQLATPGGRIVLDEKVENDPKQQMIRALLGSK